MSADEIRDLSETLTRVETILEERSKSADVTRRWMMGLVCAIIVQTLCLVYFAGGKVATLDRVVIDVREIRTELTEIHRTR